MKTAKINNNSVVFNSYIQLPCNLFKYNISSNAMVIYSLMLRRATYVDDKTNRYIDNQGYVYVMYSTTALKKTLHNSISEKTILKAIYELEENNLLNVVKINGKKNCYYVRQIIEDTEENISPALDENHSKNGSGFSDNHSKNDSATTVKKGVVPQQKREWSNNIYNIYKYNNKSSINQIYKLGKYENIELTQEEKETLIERYGDRFNELIEKASEKIHFRKEQKPITSYYSYLIKLAETFDFKQVKDIEESKQRRKEHKIKMITHLAVSEGIPPSEDEKEILGEEEYYRLKKVARQRHCELNNITDTGKVNSFDDLVKAHPELFKDKYPERFKPKE